MKQCVDFWVIIIIMIIIFMFNNCWKQKLNSIHFLGFQQFEIWNYFQLGISFITPNVAMQVFMVEKVFFRLALDTIAESQADPWTKRRKHKKHKKHEKILKISKREKIILLPERYFSLRVDRTCCSDKKKQDATTIHTDHMLWIVHSVRTAHLSRIET